ncbi:MAG: GIY-YIG nuclease family protein [Sphingomonadaceae bacterium]|jgi:Uri superfamily endonuclease
MIDAPVSKGAYILIIDLASPLVIARPVKATLPPGRYLYAGSANGPGGIAARLRRHLRKDKKPHWHVDALTLAASSIEVLAFPGGNECDLTARLAALPGSHYPLPGFGSSDCRACTSHLLAIEAGS